MQLLISSRITINAVFDDYLPEKVKLCKDKG